MSYKIGFIGCGHRGRALARAYEGIENVVLTAVADTDADRLQEFQDKFGIQKTYTTFEEMLENEALDIVNLAAQPTLRVEPIVMAAK